MSFGENLRAIRVKHLMSQAELAESVGVTQSAIAKYETDSIAPNVYVAVRIAHALDVPLGRLVEEQVGEGRKEK